MEPQEVKIYRSQDLAAKGINTELAATLTFRGKTLSKGAIFTAEHRDRAQQLCKLYLDADILSLLTEHQGSLTLWFEQKDQRQGTMVSRPNLVISEPSYRPQSAGYSLSDTIPVDDNTMGMPLPTSSPPAVTPAASPTPSPTPSPVPTRKTSSQITFRGRPVARSSNSMSEPVAPPPPVTPPPVPQPSPPPVVHTPISTPSPISKILFRGRYISKAKPESTSQAELSPEANTAVAEDRYRSFFDNASDGLFQMTEEGRYLSANAALAQIYGYESAQELMMTLSQIGLQFYAEPQRRLEFLHQLHQTGSALPFEGRIYRQNGSLIWIRETVRAVRDAHGTLLHYEGSVQEINQASQDKGDLLGGRYRLLNPLGSGGFGQTFLAEDTHRPKNPLCVVKKLHSGSEDPRFLATAQKLFNSEAEILEKLGKHSQIPQLLAYFAEAQNFYLVQELIEGYSLDQEVKPGRKLPEKYVLLILKDLLSILEFVHQNGVVHRDIKPSNIIRRKSDSKLVLIDFGAVKEIHTGLSGGGKSSAMITVGTQGYMPIEQCAGKPRFNSDLYAVGMIAIEALTGMTSESLDTDPETGELKWHDQVTLEASFQRIIDKLVRYHFAARYQNATEALADLGAL